MDLKNKIIAIAGNARTGKDTLGNNFKKLLFDQGIKANTYSFAGELKKSVDSFLLEQLGISAFSENPEEKKIIRPFLVFWGTDIMRSIDNNVWVNKLTDTLPPDEVCIVTDLRFSNELDWVKNNEGISILIKRDGIEPANSSESLNNKELESNVDSVFHMAEVKDENILMLAANEILNSMITEETYQIWKATCHS
tara:strand:- start:6158 stop:6742 length:585 start_codon:yes stop_codon:yes gene_type:complete